MRVRIEALEVTLGSLDVTAAGVSGALIDESELFIAADSVAISLNSLSSDSVSPSPTLAELLQSVDEAIASVPKAGVIHELEYCQPGTCVTVNLGWQRFANGIRAQAYVPQLNVWLILEKRDSWQIVSFGETGEAKVFAELLMREEAGTLELTNSIWVLPEKFPVPGVEIDMRAIGLQGLSRVPVTTTLDELLVNFVATNEVSFEAEAKYLSPEIELVAAGEYRFGVRYSDQDLIASILSTPDIEVNIPDVGSGLVQVDQNQASNECVVSLGLGVVDCKIAALRSSWRVAQDALSLAADINVNSIDVLLAQNIPTVRGSIELQARDLKTEQTHIKASGSFEFVGEEQLQLGFMSPQIEWQVQDVGSGVVSLPGSNRCEADATVTKLDCQFATVKSSWDIDMADAGRFAADINASPLEIGLQQVPEVNPLRQLSTELTLSMFDLSEGQSLFEGPATVEIKDQTASIQIETGKLLGAKLSMGADYELNSGAGHANVAWAGKKSLSAIARYGAAKAKLDKTSRDIAGAVRGGFEFSSEASFQISEALTFEHDSALKLKELELDYDGYVLKNAQVQLSSSGYPGLQGRVQFTGDTLDVGVPISNLQVQAGLQGDAESMTFSLQTEQLSLSLLGGQVLGHDVQYGSATGSGSGVFAVDRVQVKDMLALQKQAIEGTGVISGSVPVQFDGGKVSVNEAFVAALAPGGYIRYKAEPSVRALAKTNPAVAVVLDAMEDFQYHTLQATVDFLPDGKMLAKTSVKGANPNYQGGRQVHLNLNLEENILVLLRSLRLGSDIAEKISEKRSQGTSGKN